MFVKILIAATVSVAVCVLVWLIAREVLIFLRIRRAVRLVKDVILLMEMASELPHKHKCSRRSCGFVWQHTSLEGLAKCAHKCPSCGKEQRLKYFGPESPGDLALLDQPVTCP